MKNRRDFLKGSVAAAAVLAGSAAPALSYSAGPVFPGVIYTSEAPGKWAKKVLSHAPKVTIEKGIVTITTLHGMSRKHFIVRHTLVLEDGKVAGEKTFYPEDEEAVSTHKLPAGYKGKIFATSFCNLHDMWLTEARV